MRELNLIKENLEYQQDRYEKKIFKKSAKIIDNLADYVKDIAFGLGTSMVLKLISGFNKRKKKN